MSYFFVYDKNNKLLKKVEMFKIPKSMPSPRFQGIVIGSEIIIWDEIGTFEGLFKLDINSVFYNSL